MFKSLFGGDFVEEKADLNHSISSNLNTTQNNKHDDDEVEYLFIEENPFGLKAERPVGSFGPLPMRTNSDKLLYGTGAIYLAGLSCGGIYGLLRGLRQARGKSFKMQSNSVLNMVTRYGPFAANSVGVMSNPKLILAMGWVLIDSGLQLIRSGKSDYINHISSGFLTGFLFKSTCFFF